MTATSLAPLLTRLGIADTEWVSVCHDRGGTFTSEIATATDAPGVAARVNGAANVWFGVNPLRHRPPSGRGTAADVARLAALFADLDVKPGGLPDMAAAVAVVKDVDAVLGVPAPVLVETGNGVHAYWPVADGHDTDRAAALLARFGVLVRMVAERHGGTADTVQDLARVLRVPGTSNVKDPARPLPVKLLARDVEPDPLTLDRIEDALDAYGVPWPRTTSDTREAIAPPSGWLHTDRTCHYAQAMVSGWQHDTPTARHPWLLAQAIRLAAAHRYGCLTEQAHHDALALLHARFLALLATPPRRDPADREVADVHAHARQVVARHTDSEVAAELGHHTHDRGDVPVTLLPGQPPDTDPLADLEPLLFDATPVLSHIRQAAWSRLESPWTVLGGVLARVTAEVPAHYALPAVVGSHHSLNLAVGLVGPSGGGKTAAYAISGELLPPHYARPIGAATGEGLAEHFLRWDSDQQALVLRDDRERHALMYVDEIAQLGAVQSRKGATIASRLRTMMSGAAVGDGTADTRRRRWVPAHAYRLAVVAGVQPALSGVLFDDTDAGTPQRFLWFPTRYPNLPDPEPDWPGLLGWTLPTVPLRMATPDGIVPLRVPDTVAAFVKANRRLAKAEQGDAIDGHTVATRLKVGMVLSLLHGEPGMTEPMWDLAGVVMDASARTRDNCRHVLATVAEQEHRQRGGNDAHREAGARAARTERATRQAAAVWRAVTRHADGTGANRAHDSADGCSRRCLTYPLRHHPDADPDAVIATAEQLGYIEPRGERWSPGPSQPADSGAAA